MRGVTARYTNAQLACRLAAYPGPEANGPGNRTCGAALPHASARRPSSGVHLTPILAAAAAALLASAAVGFAQPAGNNKPASAAPAGKTAPAADAPSLSAQQKQEQQVFGQLAKAWTDYLAGSLAGAREAAEKLTRSDRETVRKEAAYLLARCLWDSGSDESRAVARKTWDDLGKDKTESGIRRQQIAKAILLEAAGKPKQAIAALVAVAKDGLEDISTVEAAIELSKLVEDPGKAPEAAKALATAETVARKLLNGKDPVAKALAKRYDELWKNSKRSVLNPAARFILSLVKDLRGNIWIGTEDSGVFRYNPDAEPASQWTQFTTKDGLGDDNAYAIACDKQGRIWVGQQCHGVAVYDGQKWKNYDVLDGPIGERIFDIACCPTDGDVWMATSAGLTRYRVKEDSWCHYTRADGLPEDQANTIAFDRAGTIYVGTQCHGIATAKSAGDYKAWRTITAPERFGPNGALYSNAAGNKGEGTGQKCVDLGNAASMLWVSGHGTAEAALIFGETGYGLETENFKTWLHANYVKAGALYWPRARPMTNVNNLDDKLRAPHARISQDKPGKTYEFRKVVEIAKPGGSTVFGVSSWRADIPD